MKTLHEFLHDIDTNDDLSSYFEQTETMDELCQKAKEYGYDFTEDELTECYLSEVSGGFLDTDKSSYNGEIGQEIDGNNNCQINFGSVTVGDGAGDSSQSGTSFTPLEKLQIVYWALNQKK